MTTVYDNKALSRFELEAEGRVAFANYRLAPARSSSPTRKRRARLRGRGIASELIKGALEIDPRRRI